MGLVIETDIIENFILLQALSGWFGIQNMLKTNNPAKCLCSITDVKLKQSS